MKRTSSLVAALTGAALLIASCSSTAGGTAVAASSAASSAVAASSASSRSTSSASTAAASTAAASSAPASSAASSQQSSSGSPTTSATGSAPVTTVGDSSGALDAQSKVWFTAFCSGLAPMVTASGSLNSLSTTAASDPTAAIKRLVTVFLALGASLTKTAAVLKVLPPPTFQGGDAFAAKVVSAFGTAGPAITAEANKIAADPSVFVSSMGGLSDSLTKAVVPLEELSSLKLTTATQNAIESLPACAKIKSLSGG